jgi:hypothetical protein
MREANNSLSLTEPTLEIKRSGNGDVPLSSEPSIKSSTKSRESEAAFYRINFEDGVRTRQQENLRMNFKYIFCLEAL